MLGWTSVKEREWGGATRSNGRGVIMQLKCHATVQLPASGHRASSKQEVPSFRVCLCSL